MGIAQKTQPEVKLIVGLIAKNKTLILLAQKSLEKRFGNIDLESDYYKFDYTDYYEQELGIGLLRKYASFIKLIKPDQLVGIKLKTNNIENGFLTCGSRTVNIDPGYIALGKLVLASTKDHQHRIYLQKGIFNEVTLRFVGKSFARWEWTYPDYAQKESIGFFNRVREIYKKQIRKGG